MTKVSVTRVVGETNERESHVMNPYLNSTLTLAATLHGAIDSLTDRITKLGF